MALGANLHAGILVVPPLAGLLAAESLQWLWTRRGPPLGSGLGLAVAAAAPLLNPYGWRLYQVPIEIAHLVGLPHIPNPEWISPSFRDVPPLYVAIAASLALLALRERRLARWTLLVMTSALALHYVRNVGLFFALLPIAVARRWPMPALGREGATARRRCGGWRRSRWPCSWWCRWWRSPAGRRHSPSRPLLPGAGARRPRPAGPRGRAALQRRPLRRLPDPRRLPAAQGLPR
jgi:hypothetical protein